MRRRDLILGLGAAATAFAQDGGLSAELDKIYGGRQGAAVLLDAARGGVVAAHRLDRAATRLASPGSAIKPFTLLALIESGALGKSGRLRCTGGAAAGDGSLRCTHPRVSVPLDAAQALAWSCNSWFWQAAARLDPARFMNLLERFGFGSVSGVTPLENSGELETPRSGEEVRRMALGMSCVRVTPAILAATYRRLAHLRSTKEASYGPIWKGLEDAVKDGTAQLAEVDGLSVAGKTGTAFDRGGDFTHAWFAGWAPADKPRVVLSVFFERGKGATEAAPAAGAIFRVWRQWDGSRPR